MGDSDYSMRVEPLIAGEESESTTHSWGSYGSAFVIVVNVIIGTGVLAVPRAFYEAGWLLAVIVLAIFAFSAYCTIVWLYECQLRVFALNSAYLHGCLRIVPGARPSASEPELLTNTAEAVPEGSKEYDPLNPPETATMPYIHDVKQVVSSTSAGLYHLQLIMPAESIPTVDYSKMTQYLEMDDISTAFGGRPVSLGWNISQLCFMMAGLWLYLVVLAETALLVIPVAGYTKSFECNIHDKKAFDDQPHCTDAMRIWVAIFFLFYVITLFRNWKAIDYAQRLATVMVYTALMLMIITTAVAMADKPFMPNGTKRIQAVKEFGWDKFSALFGVCALCLLCHPCSTLMLRAMPCKKHVPRVYAVSFIFIIVIYTVMSLVIILYMGDNVDSVVTLNWQSYGKAPVHENVTATGTTYPWGPHNGFARFLGIFVAVFPVFSVGAALTLYIRALAESIEAILPMSLLKKIAGLFGREYNGPQDGLYPVGHVIRYICLIIPTGVTLITFAFGKALAVAGFFAFFLVYFMPLVMQVVSKRLMQSVGIPASPLETWTGHVSIVVAVVIISIGSAAYYVQSQMIPTLEKSN